MSNRPETGPMRFENDWTGFFIRGDHSCYYAFVLKQVLKRFGDQLDSINERAPLESLVIDLSSSNEFNEYREVQEMKKFEECIRGEEEDRG